MVQTDGNDHVLVVDAGGSQRCAVFGDMLAAFAIDNNWAGIVINGLIRDSRLINDMAIGVQALGTIPIKSDKKGAGEIDVTIELAGLKIKPGDYIYCDEDGILVSNKTLI